MANNFHDGRIVLLGDSAHSFPPAGGMGMNSGLLDAHNLSFRINEGLSRESLSEYSTERRISVTKNLETANVLYERSLQIAKSIGLDIRSLNLLESIIEPLKNSGWAKKAFDFGIKMGTMHLRSDLVCQGLAKELKSKNLHIPMILPENEFQAVIRLSNRSLYLLPLDNMIIIVKNGEKTETVEVPLRLFSNVIKGKESKICLSNRIETSERPSNSSTVVLDIPTNEMKAQIETIECEERTYFISSQQLREVLAKQIPQDAFSSGKLINLRKDGYLEMYH